MNTNNQVLIDLGKNIYTIKAIGDEVFAFIKINEECSKELIAKKEHNHWSYNSKYIPLIECLDPEDRETFGFLLASRLMESLENVIKDEMFKEYNQLLIDKFENTLNDKSKRQSHKLEAEYFNLRLLTFCHKWGTISILEKDTMYSWSKDLLEKIVQKMDINEKIINGENF